MQNAECKMQSDMLIPDFAFTFLVLHSLGRIIRQPEEMRFEGRRGIITDLERRRAVAL
jgi:hypothetical protein